MQKTYTKLNVEQSSGFCSINNCSKWATHVKYFLSADSSDEESEDSHAGTSEENTENETEEDSSEEEDLENSEEQLRQIFEGTYESGTGPFPRCA